MINKNKIKPGDTVWCVDNEGDYASYLYMASCGDYIICAAEYVGCSFGEQLAEMADECGEENGIEFYFFYADNVFATREEAEESEDD